MTVSFSLCAGCWVLFWLGVSSVAKRAPVIGTTSMNWLSTAHNGTTTTTAGSSVSSGAVIRQKRPFYNIAHMVNSLKEIDYYLAKGANALETDIYFAPNATPVFTFHGYPCDCFRHCDERERVEVFLERVRELTTPTNAKYNKRLILLLLDLKMTRIPHSARALAGQNLATYLMHHLYNGTDQNGSGSTIRTVISINHVFDYDFILGFENELENLEKSWLFRNYIGWDVGMNDPIFAIESLWKRIDSIQNIWQGDGTSNCLSPFYNLGRLSSIVKRRDHPSLFAVKNYIRKVYQWTVDLTVNIRTALRSNVDAIITNHPERLLHVIREREFASRYRLARASDSPWDRVMVKSSGKSGSPITATSTSPANMANPTLGLKLVNGAGDMFDSLTKFVGEMLRHRSPVRYLYLSTYTSQRRSAEQQHSRIGLRDERTVNSTVANVGSWLGSFVAKYAQLVSIVKSVV